MGYPDHYRAVIEGDFLDGLGNTIEKWSTSYRVATTTLGTDRALNEDDYIDNELTDFCNRLFHTAYFDPSVAVTKLSFNRIGSTGRYADPAHSHYKILSGTDRIRGGRTGGNPPKFPPQVCLVATLRSDLDRGAGAYGRMFLPVTVNLETTYQAEPGQVDGLQAAVKDAFEHADGLQPGWITGERFFPALVTPKGAGSVHEVTRVGVGRTFDTMRSRRRSLPEATVLSTLS